MRSVRFRGAGGIELADVPEPVAGPGEVVVETAASALCGSELHAWRGAGSRGNPGHEAAGTVVAVGAGVSSPRLGERVGVSAVAGCGACAHCAAGRYTWCARHRVVVEMHAERFVVPALACHVLPDDVPWEVGVLLSGDGLGVPYHAFARTQATQAETIAVFGLGPVGLGTVLVHAHAGRRVVGVDPAPYRRALALRLGAEAAVTPDEAAAAVATATGGAGVDLAIDAAGRPETVAGALAAARAGGAVHCSGELAAAVISPSRDLIRRDLAVSGAWFYHFHEFAGMLALYRAGLDVASLVTHRFALGDAASAYAAFAGGVTGKVMLRPAA